MSVICICCQIQGVAEENKSFCAPCDRARLGSNEMDRIWREGMPESPCERDGHRYFPSWVGDTIFCQKCGDFKELKKESKK